jgi:polyhydroxyalkanoate synthesis regulator phasin
MRGGSHPIDDYLSFLEMYANAMTGAMEQFHLPIRRLAEDCAKEWQKAFMTYLAGIGFPAFGGADKLDEKVTSLEKENEDKQVTIEKLEAESNEKRNLANGHEDRISELKSELASKKREITLKKKKIESLSQQVSDLKKLAKEVKPKTSPKKKVMKKSVSSNRVTSSTV